MSDARGAVRTFVKVARARDDQGEGERWAEEAVHPTLNVFDNGDARCVCAVVCRHGLASLGKGGSAS